MLGPSLHMKKTESTTRGVQVHFKLLLIMEANTMNPYQIASKGAVWSWSIVFGTVGFHVY